jgi:hypothetical protein
VRVSRKKLIELAYREAKRRAEVGDVISGYVIGSVAAGNPILGGTADIDLVLIHRSPTGKSQERVALSQDFHLDIIHHDIEVYSDPTSLRVNPWLGPSMCEPIFLYDPEHFFERAQAGVRGQFYRVDFALARANAFLARARRFKADSASNSAGFENFLHALFEAANAAGSVAGFPAAGRRAILTLKERFQSLGRPDLFDAFRRLLGADKMEGAQLKQGLNAWDEASETLSPAASDAQAARKRYHRKGLIELIDRGHATAALWVLLTSWVEAESEGQEKGEAANHSSLVQFLADFGFSEEARKNRMAALEEFQDEIEAFLEDWADRSGAWDPTTPPFIDR